MLNHETKPILADSLGELIDRPVDFEIGRVEPPVAVEKTDEAGWIVEDFIALCPKCRCVREGTAAWFLSHWKTCDWRPTPFEKL